MLTTSSPRHPKEYGLAKRAVQICKNMLRMASTGRADIFAMLLDSRITSVKGLSMRSAQLCAGRSIRNQISVLTSKLTPKIPTGIAKELMGKQLSQKIFYDKTDRT